MVSRLRRATDADWERFFGAAAPGNWIGLVADDGGQILGIGGVYLAIEGRWWVTFARAPGVRMLKTAQRAARITVETARDAGLTVFALADPAIEGSDTWLRRLGFKETDEFISGDRVWTR